MYTCVYTRTLTRSNVWIKKKSEHKTRFSKKNWYTMINYPSHNCVCMGGGDLNAYCNNHSYFACQKSNRMPHQSFPYYTLTCFSFSFTFFLPCFPFHVVSFSFLYALLPFTFSSSTILIIYFLLILFIILIFFHLFIY
jgi:hypothetical protein